MTRPTDITLMAYADGYLDSESRAAVEAHLISDAAARRQVRQMTMTKLLTQEAFADRDFSIGTERLAAAIRRHQQPSPTPTPRRRNWLHVGWLTGGAIAGPALSGLAAGLVASLVTVAMLDIGQTVRAPVRAELALGEVPASSMLRRALDAVADHRALPLGAMPTGFQPVAEFKDKFGQTCVEVDAVDTSPIAIPSAVVVACRDVDRTWTVVGIVATRTERNGGPRPYARDADQAHDAMSGVLNMLGASQRTSAIRNESETR